MSGMNAKSVQGCWGTSARKRLEAPSADAALPSPLRFDATRWRDKMPKVEDDPPSSDFGATRNEDDFEAIRRQWLG